MSTQGIFVGIDPNGPNAGDTYRNRHNRQDWLVFSRTVKGVVTLLSPDKRSKADYSIQALEIDFEKVTPPKVIRGVPYTAMEIRDMQNAARDAGLEPLHVVAIETHSRGSEGAYIVVHEAMGPAEDIRVQVKAVELS